MDIPGVDFVHGLACGAAFIVMMLIALWAERLRPSRKERHVETSAWCVLGYKEGQDPGWQVQKIKFINGEAQVPSRYLIVFQSGSYDAATTCLAQRLAKDREDKERKRKPR